MTNTPPAPVPDSHALVITSDEVISPSGIARPWQVTSPEKLSAVLVSWKPRYLRVDGTTTNVPSCWLVGVELLETLGMVADGDTTETLKDELAQRWTEFVQAMPDWKLRWKTSGGWAYLEHRSNGQAVDLILEPYFHLTAGQEDMGIVGDGDRYDLPEDDGEAGRELARRLYSHIELLKVMPRASASAVGAELAARDNRARRKPIEATYLPELDGTQSGAELPEFALDWFADRVDPAQLDNASRLVRIDMRNAYLASAQTDLGWGEPTHVGRGEAEALIVSKKLPQAWWQITVDRYIPRTVDWGLLPAPRPIRTTVDDGERIGERTEKVWVTTTTLKYLMLPEDQGGIGRAPQPHQAWVFPHSGRPLTEWVALLKHVLIAAEWDERPIPEGSVPQDWQQAMSGFYYKAVYKAYIGRMARATTWRSKSMRQHIQPFWQQTIVANTRGRAMIYAYKLWREHGLTPLSCATDEWTYVVPEGLRIDNDFDYSKGYLGKYRVKEGGDIALNTADRKLLATADSAPAVAAALAKITARRA